MSFVTRSVTATVARAADPSNPGSQTMPYEEILYEVADRVATVTLNRPAKLNAWTPEMEREVREALEQAERDDAVRHPHRGRPGSAGRRHGKPGSGGRRRPPR